MEEPPPLCRWNSAGWPLSNAYAYRVKVGLPNVDPICPSGSLTGSKMRQENSRPRYGAGVDGMSSVPELSFRNASHAAIPTSRCRARWRSAGPISFSVEPAVSTNPPLALGDEQQRYHLSNVAYGRVPVRQLASSIRSRLRPRFRSVRRASFVRHRSPVSLAFNQAAQKRKGRAMSTASLV